LKEKVNQSQERVHHHTSKRNKKSTFIEGNVFQEKKGLLDLLGGALSFAAGLLGGGERRDCFSALGK